MSRLVPIVLEGRYIRLEPLGLHHVTPLLEAVSGPRTFAILDTEWPAVKARLQSLLR